MSEDMSRDMSEDMSEEMLEDMSEEMSEEMPEEMSEDMPKDMSEICQTRNPPGNFLHKIRGVECQKNRNSIQLIWPILAFQRWVMNLYHGFLVKCGVGGHDFIKSLWNLENTKNPAENLWKSRVVFCLVPDPMTKPLFSSKSLFNLSWSWAPWKYSRFMLIYCIIACRTVQPQAFLMSGVVKMYNPCSTDLCIIASITVQP